MAQDHHRHSVRRYMITNWTDSLQHVATIKLRFHCVRKSHEVTRFLDIPTVFPSKLIDWLLYTTRTQDRHCLITQHTWVTEDALITNEILQKMMTKYSIRCHELHLDLRAKCRPWRARRKEVHVSQCSHTWSAKLLSWFTSPWNVQTAIISSCHSVH